ncbi:MAG: ATP-binding protein [Bacteroidales bacterium]|nr:ATP-binding protein [Bacteroidales bacterium]
MYFERKQYLQQLTSAEGNGMIKIITGIRRCGKSYLLFNIYKQHLLSKGVPADHIIEVNLEDRRNKRLRNPDELLEHIDSKMTDFDRYYILLDEIQLVPEFEDVLNSYLHIENAEVFVTGSNAKFLSKDVITEFRGRGWEIRIRPLSFAEYYDGVGGEKQETLEKYYLYGGLPAVAQLEKPEDKQKYLKDVYETVYLKDVLQRNRLKNADGLRELVRILASTMGSSMNALRISNTFKSVSNIEIGTNTISRYLEYLQDSFIISESLRYDVKGRKYIGTETKYYFEDLGIRNAVIGFRQIEFNHTMENVIYNELCKMGYNVDIGLVKTFSRDDTGKITRKNLEIDFVVNRHDQRLYIQSAYRMPDEEKLEQELASFRNLSDGFRKILIEGDRYITHYNEEGILVMSLYDFLLKGLIDNN